MSGQPELRGTLHIQAGKKGRSFKVSYTNLKGRDASMPVQEQALFFDREKAAEGDEVILTLNATGQIEKCSIPGKEGIPPKPAAAKSAYGAKGSSNSPSGRGTYGMQSSERAYKNGGQSSRTFGKTAFAAQSAALCDAVAPYNFITYDPEAVLEEKGAECGSWSGVLHCRLKALTPLLVAGERRKRPDESSECRFFNIEGKNVIPGSSIKGVLRSMVEILSFSAMRQVSHRELFWRIVTGAAYREAFSDEILGGYLHRKGADYELFPVMVKKVTHGNGPLSGGERVKTGGIKNKEKSDSHDYLFSPPSGKAMPVDREVVAVFERQMTEAQKKRWNSERCSKGYGHPVFYRKDAAGAVAELGLCRYFRLKYRMSPADLAESSVAEDFADRLFGRVGTKKAIKGRVAVQAAFVQGREYRENGCRAVLSTPHPTSLAHYIVQDPSRIRTISRGEKNDPESLAAYSKGEKLRGWKLYWHHDVDEHLWFAEGTVPASTKVQSWLYPLDSGACAEVKIHVDRLTDLELGAVLEALSLACGDQAWKLGMGKALGFGSITLELLHAEVEDVRKRYASLAERLKGSRPSLDAEAQKRLREQFRQNRLERLHELGKWESVRKYEELPPVRQLRLMTNFTRRPPAAAVRYMSLNEFEKKALLVGPEETLKRKRP